MLEKGLKYICTLSLAISWLLISGCSSDKFLSGNQRILSKVDLTSTSKNVSPSDYRAYIRQEANSRWFNLVKVPLGIYCCSGTDSTKRMNRFLRRLGEAPVVYDNNLENFSVSGLSGALQNKGYLRAQVSAERQYKGKKIALSYQMMPGRLFYVDSISRDFDNEEMERACSESLKKSLLYKGMPFDASILDNERKRIMTDLHAQGFYGLNKEFITYNVDTLAGNNSVSLQMIFAMPPGVDSSNVYKRYHFNKVRLHENMGVNEEPIDSFLYHGLYIYSGGNLKMQKRLYNRCVDIHTDSLYSEEAIQNTYGVLNGLQALKSTSVRLNKVDETEPLLDCDIYVYNNKRNSISTELEGTNTAGDLGAAASLSYSNNNLFKGAEVFTLKARGAYEAITGLEGYSNQNYIEYSLETGLRFPTFMLPFISTAKMKSMKASSEVNFFYDSQNRPEFHRRLVSGSWFYRWAKNSDPRFQHRFDLISLNYVFMPWISDTFQKNYLDATDSRNSVLRYSYENLFIMRSGYNFLFNSSRNAITKGIYQTNAYQIRFGFEMAGNLLYAISKMLHGQQDSKGQYSLLNIAYSQYVKIDFDFAKSFLINERNSVVFHTAFGLAQPYGNSTIIPYEKRYFSGGANSVRGWSVRELGPGRFIGKDGKVDFINQTGNLKLDLNLEYRTFLFWKLHAAAYIDAGNIWNTRNYSEQPGGQFKFDSFYRQIAVSYGLGFRLNFDYFILRFDTGMKAINPAYTDAKLHYPLIHPKFSRDFAFHFAVGLPF